MTTPIAYDRIRETSSTTGTGAVTLTGAFDSVSFTFVSVYSVGNTLPYVIINGTSQVEWGIGTYSGTNTLTRTTVLGGSNGTSAVSFSAITSVFVAPLKELSPLIPSYTLPQVTLQDNFIDTNATNLTAHAMTRGPGWTVSSGTWTIQGDLAKSGTVDGATATVDFKHSDVSLQCDVLSNFSGSDYTAPGIVARFVDANNYWHLDIDTNQQKLNLIKWISGSPTVVQQANISVKNGEYHTLTFVLNGTAILGKLDNYATVSATDSYLQTATIVGLRAGLYTSSAPNFWGDFSATFPEAASIPVAATHVITDGIGWYPSQLTEDVTQLQTRLSGPLSLNLYSQYTEHLLVNQFTGSFTNNNSGDAGEATQGNVLCLWHWNNNGASATRFLKPGVGVFAERGAVGSYFDGGAFNGTFIEGSNLDLASAPTPVGIVITGVIGGSFGNYRRIAAEADGSVHWYSLNAGASAPNDWLHADANGNIIVGSGALATNATNGFLYLDTCAGRPTGTPTSVTGRSAVVYNSTDKLLHGYSTIWQDINPSTRRLTANVTNATATFANLSDLTINLPAAGTYVGNLVLKCVNSVAAEGIQIDFAGSSATMTSFWAGAGILASGGSDTVGTNVSTSLAGVINFTLLTGETVIEVDVSLVVNAAGTFIPRVAENSHVTGTLTAELGSFLTLLPSTN